METLHPEHYNPEVKSPSRDVPQPEPVKASEDDKEKLRPKENDDPTEKKELNKKDGKPDVAERPEHPKLEAPNSIDHAVPNGTELQEPESAAHTKLRPNEAKPP